ncbi:MAG TPA: VapC toxin family PIN domain ribonuclease [Verrucomicrobiales bacterium]|nr:VapC toxin family PIN domain ribonuclease [Verrucomicrobiales bacterium]HIL69219.1 VapC toxin family PIN domain ribonuclease [Verrucomicrobiota bacterium]
MSVRYLLDVNVLVAWGWSDHMDHDRTVHWIRIVMKKTANRILTSSIPQLGFVRVSVQRSLGQVKPAKAGQTLQGMLNALGKHHEFLSDDQSSIIWPTWCQGASRTTDAHLLTLARAHNARLATLDKGIPNAFLIG